LYILLWKELNIISCIILIMAGFGRHGEVELECPFCGKSKIRVYHKEGLLQAKTSRIAAGAKQTFHKRPDEYHVQQDCPECGKTKKEIEKAFETGITKQETHEDKIKRFRKSGIPMRVEG
jgi:rubredoxin